MEITNENNGGLEEVAMGLREEMARVVVSNVYNGGSTVEMDMRISETIGALKSRLCESLEDKPAPSEQRLIYCGKICRDDQIPLGQVLRDLESPQTFHLVLCKKSKSTPQITIPKEAKPRAVQSEPQALNSNDGLEAVLNFRKNFVQGHTNEKIFEEALRNGAWTISIPQETATPSVAASTNDLARESRLAAHFSNFMRRWQAHPLIASLDIKLFIKLVLVVALLGHDSHPRRFFVLLTSAIIAYFIQTGIGRILMNYVLNANGQQADDFDTLVHSLFSTTQTSQSGIFFNILAGGIPSAVSRPFSFFFDFGLFLSTFFFSLAPPWRPRLLASQDTTPPSPPVHEHQD